jgi:pimeloyl-ACP methyl ester carboxylesterase
LPQLHREPHHRFDVPRATLVATEDRMIPPPAQRAMSARAGSTVIEVAGSHAIYVSQPAAVADLIETAVTATTPVPISA